MTSLIKIPFASSGDKTAVPDTDSGGGVNMTQGYGQAYQLDPTTDPSAKRVERDKMNWLFNRITSAINEIQIGGIAPFITSADNGGAPFAYGKGAIVLLNGVAYQSLEASNTTTPPDAKWSVLGNLYDSRAEFSGTVGDSRNARMSVSAASATATFTADSVIVEDSAGRQYRVKSLSANINLASTGAGGMDTGTAPASGFVALYAIYNPTNGNKAMLAVNATSAALPEIYGGSNMPSGYTASALLCVVPTDSAGKLVPLLQAGRKTLIETAQLSSTTVFIPTLTALNVSTAVPKNAKSLDGLLYLVSSNSTRPVISVQPLNSPAVGVKQLVCGNSTGVNNSQAPFSDLAIPTPQTIYWRVSEGIPGDTISSAFVYATAYSI